MKYTFPIVGWDVIIDATCMTGKVLSEFMACARQVIHFTVHKVEGQKRKKKKLSYEVTFHEQQKQ